jgi:8-oxo-dGTP pyrophosphatase MutT (NUDIX family)
MNFDLFLKTIPKIQKAKLLGEEAHKIMVPKVRIALMKDFDASKSNPKKASILMLVYPKQSKSHLVLILRASYNGVHSSQVAFPGGKVETFDADYCATALRETHEEIGVSSDKIEIIKDFTPTYIPPSNFMVYPFLGYSSEELVFSKDTEEVSDIIELPLDLFLDDSILTSQIMNTSYMDFLEVPGFQIENNFVWGATAMMLSELKEVLKSVL